MAKMEYRHDFSTSDAMDRVRALTDYWGASYGVKSEWSDDGASISGKVRGASFTGHVHFSNGLVQAEIKAGFLAERLGGKAYVERKIKEYLDEVNSLEELRARIKK